MLTLLHISDLHFGKPYTPKVGSAVLRSAAELEPNVVVVSGDLTQRAREEQFEEASAFLARLPEIPKIIVPGNHDVPLFRLVERLRNPYGLYRRHIHRELNRVWHLEKGVIVALNSTSPRRAISNGRITKETLAFCERAFADVPQGNIKIVVAHHHFVPAPDYLHDQTMPKAKRAMNRFIDLGVELILGGHLHRAYIGNSLDVYPGKHRERGAIIVQCGTTTSRRGRAKERQKNSFNLIKIGGDMLRVTHYMYFEALDRFAPISRHIFPRPGKQFVEGTLHDAD